MTIYDVVKKLLGAIEPIGESNADEKRFHNLQVTTKLIDKLVFDVAAVAKDKGSYQHSVKKTGVFASEFLEALGIEE